MKELSIKDYYVCEDLKGRRVTFTFNDVHKNFRLWDITKDAKDGDILVIESGRRNNECLFIFKDIACREVLEHCYYRTNDSIFSPTGSFIGYLNNIYHPATQKQRDLLFQKMKEAGYEWDAEKKELKNIEQMPAWSEEDKNFMYDTLSNLTELKDRYGEGYGNVGNCIKWLKSLKERIGG